MRKLAIILTMLSCINYLASALTTSNVLTKTATTLSPNTSFVLDCATVSQDAGDRTVESNTLALTLSYGDVYTLGVSQTFASSLELKITPYFNGLPFDTKAETVLFNISSANPYGQIILDVTNANWCGTSGAYCTLTSFEIEVLNSSFNTFAQSSIQFKAEHKLEYTFSPYAPDITTYINIFHTATFQKEFSWSPLTTSGGNYVYDIPAWQFQLLRLYNVNPNKNTEYDIDAYVDWSKSLSLFLEGTQTSIDLTIPEGQGYYLWRVRPIGNYYEGGIGNSQNYKDWTDAADLYTLTDIDGSPMDPSNVFFFFDADRNVNWTYTRTFSEGDDVLPIKFTEAKVYANGLTQTMQQQSKRQTQKCIAASQIVYDYTGAARIQTLGVPVNTQQVFKYIDDMMLNTNGETYTAASFSAESNYNQPLAVSDNCLLGYYSDFNPDLNIPSAGGYPFALANSLNDGTGRPKAVSGVGYDLRIGGDHTTRYEYDMASCDILIDLFGDEAMSKDKVAKTTVTNPDGLKYVVYTNFTGKTLASCVADNSSVTKFDQLESANGDEHHFTLFYYDRGGKLVRTVSPKGEKDASGAYNFVTQYEYDLVGNLLMKNSPDGGEIKYWYDDKGRIRISQNAEQIKTNIYSYIKYDDLGRIVESGESLENYELLNSENPEDALVLLWLMNDNDFPSTDCSSQSYTVYSDVAPSTVCYKQQENIRNRVSYAYTNEGAYTVYSYDVHGNVVWTLQKLPNFEAKLIEYEYDLLSGLVTQEIYNKGYVDQFYRKYAYDADKRIIASKSSKGGNLWDTDAVYKYYDYGPLKRVELGQNQVQGIDYTYTIQGWLKGINHPSLSSTDDPGRDGNLAAGKFAKDAFGQMLNYFEGDFNRTGSAFNSTSTTTNTMLSSLSTTHKNSKYSSLYSGLISNSVSNNSATSAQVQQHAGKPMVGMYKYNEVGFLKQSVTDFYELDETGSYNNWLGATGISGDIFTGDYYEHFGYDANGNITSIVRNAYKQ